jgi:sulfite exporter TauE/SafE
MAETRVLEKLVPGLLYNGGRILSYTIVGALAGALGGAFSFSPFLKGIIAGVAGVFMVALGFRMLGILPPLPDFSRFVPSFLRRTTGRPGSLAGKRGPFAVGILNGIMPCGPLQTMQLYALGTGSLAAGAFSMFVFALGTVALLLVFSVAASLLPRKFIPAMIKTSAVLVMFLGMVTLARAFAFAGLALPDVSAFSSSGVSVGTEKAIKLLTARKGNGIQSVLTVFGSSDYVPFQVTAGIPLKWTIRIAAEDLTGCNSTVVIPSYGIEKKLAPGDNLIEFTPKDSGTIAYSCWMGMIRSRITVVPDDGKPAPVSPGTKEPNPLLIPEGS